LSLDRTPRSLHASPSPHSVRRHPTTVSPPHERTCGSRPIRDLRATRARTRATLDISWRFVQEHGGGARVTRRGTRSCSNLNMTNRVFAMMVLVVLAASRSWAQADAGSARTAPCRAFGADLHMPDTIQVADDLRRSVDTMLRKSAAFRSQCRQIARAPQLYARVKIDPRIVNKPYRARSTICRLTSGAIVAVIDIAAVGDPTELLAHEFEHLIEQLDGLELRDLARRRQGAWHSDDEMFETDRAIRMGRTVLDEVRGGARVAARMSASPVDGAGRGDH
jgi:hypothetical protein